MKKLQTRWSEIVIAIAILAIMYFAVVSFIFSYRNPLSNRTAIFRDFHEVMTFQKVDVYQIKNHSCFLGDNELEGV